MRPNNGLALTVRRASFRSAQRCRRCADARFARPSAPSAHRGALFIPRLNRTTSASRLPSKIPPRVTSSSFFQ